jgi:hypothetical protein
MNRGDSVVILADPDCGLQAIVHEVYASRVRVIIEFSSGTSLRTLNIYDVLPEALWRSSQRIQRRKSV